MIFNDIIKLRSLFLIAILAFASLASAAAKNVILMIADGGGMAQFESGSYFEYGEIGHQVYDSPVGSYQWVKLGCATYSYGGKYDPENQWADFNNQNSGATDSSAAATALNTGTRINNGQLNITPDRRPLATFGQLASAAGHSVGILTSVSVSHATPAGAWAHNASRNNGKEIFHEMLYNSPNLDVIIGGGHPWYDDAGNPRDTFNDSGMHPTQDDWLKLTTGRVEDWFFTDQKEVIRAIAQNKLQIKRLFAVPRVAETFQLRRPGRGMQPFNDNIPSLAECSRAALNVLKQNDKGFYLMIEGGAVDWACHDNNYERMIQEQMRFNQAVREVVSWVNENSSFDDTLLIITADHECGCLWGDKGKFESVKSNGKGFLPTAVYNSGGHTNQLVPLFAIGAGSGRFLELVDGWDAKAAEIYKALPGWNGSYVENIDVYKVMSETIMDKIK